MRGCRSLVKRVGLKILWLSVYAGSNPVSLINFFKKRILLKNSFNSELNASLAQLVERHIGILNKNVEVRGSNPRRGFQKPFISKKACFSDDGRQS